MPRKCADQLWFRDFIFLLATMTASRSWLGRGQYSLVPRVRETPNVARQEQKLKEARLLKCQNLGPVYHTALLLQSRVLSVVCLKIERQALPP